MPDLLLVGTDTDAGKTTVALLWLARFHARYAAWKPVETGVADSATLAQLVPEAVVHPSVAANSARVPLWEAFGEAEREFVGAVGDGNVFAGGVFL